MSRLDRVKNRTIAKVINRFPSLSKKLIDSYTPLASKDIPWTPVKKLLTDSRIALITTAGVHHINQMPFDMTDREGDPTYRVIDIQSPESELMITHDYYDHADADRDINIIFPIERLKELVQEGLIGKLADIHYGFMGHIVGRHIQTLIKESAPEVARRLKADNVNAVLLTPG